MTLKTKLIIGTGLIICIFGVRNKLEAAKRKCVEAEEKYGNLRGTVARMMEISSTFSKEISTELKIYSVLGREIDGGGEGGEEVD